jgi:hypothetical protein
MLALPLFGLLVIQETSLLTAKFWGMDRPAPVHVLTRDELVQHLMEDDVFDDIAGHEGLVQEAVDADQPIALLVGPKAYGPTLALWRSATPGNVRLHTIDEVVLVEVIIDRFKVKIAPLWLQQARTLRRWLEAGQHGMLLPYIRPYGTRGSSISVAQICHKGAPDPVRRLQKHAVQAYLIPRLSIAAGGKHRRPILSPYQCDRCSELSAEPGLSVILVSDIRRDQ